MNTWMMNKYDESLQKNYTLFKVAGSAATFVVK